jgi:hypothetical protein
MMKLRCEYSMTLIFHKISVRSIRNYYLNKLSKIFNIFCVKTTHNFERINIITTNYVYYKIVKLTLRYEYNRTLIFHKI